MAPKKTTTGAAVKKAAAKVTESKAAEKAVSAAKAAEEKLAETAKTVEEKVAETAKTVEKKAAKKTAEVKAAAKETAEKTVKTTRKKKVETTTEVYVQFWGKEVYARDVVDAVKKIWTDEMGKKEEDLKDLKVYIKPEDNGAHYVINGEITGFIEL